MRARSLRWAGPCPRPACHPPPQTALKEKIQKVSKIFLVVFFFFPKSSGERSVGIEIAPRTGWGGQSCASLGRLISGSARPPLRSAHRRSPPSPPSLGRRRHRPDGTTGCSCHHTGPSPPGYKEQGDGVEGGGARPSEGRSSSVVAAGAVRTPHLPGRWRPRSSERKRERRVFGKGRSPERGEEEEEEVTQSRAAAETDPAAAAGAGRS